MEPARHPDALTPFQMGILAFGMVTVGVSMTINFMVVAPLAREAGLSELEVAGVITLSSLLYALTTPIWARISDYVGRKPVMIFSMVAAAVSNTIFIFVLDAALKGAFIGASMFFILAATRTLFGLLAPGIHPASMGLVAETTTPQNRAAGLGLLGAAMSLGALLGPAETFLLAPFGALMPLWGAVGLSLLGALGILLYLPAGERPDPAARPRPLSPADPRLLPYLIFLFAYFVAVAASQQTLTFLVQDRFGLDQSAAIQWGSAAFAASAVATIFIQFGVVQRYRPRPDLMLKAGLATVALGYVVVALPLPYPVLVTGFGIVGAGAALTVPGTNAMASLNVSPPEQGGAAALMAMAPPAAFVFGPLIGAGAYTISPILPFALSAIAVGGLTLVALSPAIPKPEAISP